MRCLGKLLVAASVMVGSVGPVQAAELDEKEAKVLARAFGFMVPKPPQPVPVVVLTPAGSGAKAEAIKAALGPGFKVTVAEGAPGSLEGQRGLILADTSPALLAAAAKASAGTGVLTVSSDLTCADSGQCVMAVNATPKVSIVVSRAAAERNGVGFDQAFKLMITER